MLVGVQEEEQVEGMRCCPDECGCNQEIDALCSPKSISYQYTHWVLGGCTRRTCFPPPSEYTQATAETKTVSGIMAVPAAHFHLLSLNIASMNRTPGIKF